MTIAEASKKFDISADTLRYYERIGIIPPISRTSGGIRNYSESDCGWIEFAKCMRSAGLAIDVIIQYVTLFREGDSTISKRKALLIEQRDQLECRIKNMRNTLERLNKKIENYDNNIIPAQNLTAD